MKKALITAVMMGIIILAVSAPASAGEGNAFSWLRQFRLTGVGPTAPQTHMYQIFNGFMWFRDADGDGIPNGLDPDYTRPLDGTGFGPGGKISPNQEYTYQNRTRYNEDISAKGKGEVTQDRVWLRDCKGGR
ncbi:exported hypothetical protein [Candidatus Zixiibacteriota bacterium]|nr:exported hypothetical protein [candidate division Zixibacteria bacterium]